MNSGGHSGYFDCYPDTIPQELIEAINAVGYKAISDNYIKALNEGEQDDWVETDMAYYKFEPSLDKCLMEHIEANAEEIFMRNVEGKCYQNLKTDGRQLQLANLNRKQAI